MYPNDDYIRPGEQDFQGAALDNSLSMGYFRMRSMLFTTHSIVGGEYGNTHLQMPVFWLRTVVHQLAENKQARTIRKKCAGFQVAVAKALVTDEVEALHDLYKNQLAFETTDTCIEKLGGSLAENPYHTRMIEVRDGNKLIAVGYFDLGQTAIMGIANIYHPTYKQYSLGKFLMLQKIDYAVANHMHYYYTGYIGTEVTCFDYKVFPDIDAVEVFLPIEKEWKPLVLFGKNQMRDYFMQAIKNLYEGEFDLLL